MVCANGLLTFLRLGNRALALQDKVLRSLLRLPSKRMASLINSSSFITSKPNRSLIIVKHTKLDDVQRVCLVWSDERHASFDKLD